MLYPLSYGGAFSKYTAAGERGDETCGDLLWKELIKGWWQEPACSRCNGLRRIRRIHVNVLPVSALRCWESANIET